MTTDGMLRELLRPPPHRGPLIAAGAVLLSTGLALLEVRVDLAPGLHALILAPATALVLWLGMRAPSEDGRPPAYQSVLLVCGLLLGFAALLRLADAAGGDFDGGVPSGSLAWAGAVEAAGAAWIALRRQSAVCTLIAAVAFGLALLAAAEWVLDPGSFAVSRWLLLLLAGGLVLGSLRLRAARPRHAEMLIDAAGLAVLTIAADGLLGIAAAALVPFGSLPDPALPGLWEFVILAAGCGLVAYGAVDRLPGPAWLGVANLLAFVGVVAPGDATLRWWPLTLLVLGAGTIAAGLRPRDPLPPEPRAYGLGEQPLAMRTADADELVFRVRDERPPSP